MDLAYLLSPRHGNGICRDCFNVMAPQETRCRACRSIESHLDLMVPISYCLAHSCFHDQLAGYKRDADPFVPRVTTELATVLAGFVREHERCLARALAIERFDLVTTVPSGDRARDERHPLRRIVGELCEPTRARHRRVLRRSAQPISLHASDPGRYLASEPVPGASVLLVDDTWTTGSSAQAAAAALKAAGAAHVAAIVLGRYVNGNWCNADARVRENARPFTYHSCALCADANL